MSKGKRMQHTNVHVNKYARFSKAEGAQERIEAEVQRELNRQEKERRKAERKVGIWGSFNPNRPRKLDYRAYRSNDIFGKYDFNSHYDFGM